MTRSGSSLMKFTSCFSSPRETATTSAADHHPPEPGNQSPRDAFKCPISGVIMKDPVTFKPTGHVFERACIEACMEINYFPPVLASSLYAPSSLVPRGRLKKKILKWCKNVGHDLPLAISQEEARHRVETLREADQQPRSSEGVIQESSSNTEEYFFRQLMQPAAISEQMQGAIDHLYNQLTEDEGQAVALCTPRIMGTIVPLLWQKQEVIRSRTISVIVGFLQSPANRFKIVAYGSVPPLLFILDKDEIGLIDRDNVANIICCLTEEPNNRLLMGALGAVPPLLHSFCYQFTSDDLLTQTARLSAGEALCNLILCPDHSLTVLANMSTFIEPLLKIATDKANSDDLREHALKLLAELASEDAATEGLIDGGAVQWLVRMLKEGAGANGEHCLRVLHKICGRNLARFKMQATVVEAELVFAKADVEWGEEGIRMAEAMMMKMTE